MTAGKDFKKLIRKRMLRTGESYTAARRHFLRAEEAGMTRPTESPLNQPIDTLNLTVKTTKVLKQQNISTIAALRDRTEAELSDLGLAPQSRIEIREVLKELNRLGKTIVVSSHILADLEEICDAVAIMEHGHLVAGGSVEDLKQGLRERSTRHAWLVRVPSEHAEAAAIGADARIETDLHGEVSELAAEHGGCESHRTRPFGCRRPGFWGAAKRNTISSRGRRIPEPFPRSGGRRPGCGPPSPC